MADSAVALRKRIASLALVTIIFRLPVSRPPRCIALGPGSHGAAGMRVPRGSPDTAHRWGHGGRGWKVPARTDATAVTTSDSICSMRLAGRTREMPEPRSYAVDDSDPRDKIWSRFVGGTGPVKVRHIRILESDVLAPQDIELGRFTAIVGSHGSGKTTLLRMLYVAFGAEPKEIAGPPFFSEQYKVGCAYLGGVIEVTLDAAGETVTRRVDLGWAAEKRREIWDGSLPETYEVFYCDPIGSLATLTNIYQQPGRVRNHVTDPDRLRAVDLRGLRSVLGRDYTRVETWVPSDDHMSDTPYTRAWIGDREVDPTSMSSAETWVHYVLNWAIRRGTPGDLIMIDEVEAFVSSRSQRALGDEMVRYALAAEIQLIIATHSPELVARAPLEHIRICLPTPAGVRLVTPASQAQLFEAVGFRLPLRGMVLVEDALAAQILRHILAVFDVALCKEVEVVECGGESVVRQGIRAMAGAHRLAYVGVLDGDQQDAADANRGVEDVGDERILYLPGVAKPERELVNALFADPKVFYTMVGCSEENVWHATASLPALDHQYWIREIAVRLGLDPRVVTHALIKSWLAIPAVGASARTLAESIRACLLNATG